MKKILWIFFTMLVAGQTYSQQIYQVRADSVLIHNAPETAELIIENHTQDTLGFLFNKASGRTEFRKLKLQRLNGGMIAITGQDTVSVNIVDVKNVDSLWRKGDSIAYRKNNRNYAFYAPLAWGKLSDARLLGAQNQDLMRYNSPLNKWENKAFTDTILGKGTGNMLGVSYMKNFAILNNVPYDSVGQRTVALGFSAIAKREGGVAVGHLARSDVATNGIAIGSMSSSDNSAVVTIGPFASTTNQNSVTIGASASTAVHSSVIIGYKAKSQTVNSTQIALGAFSTSGGIRALAMGFGATAEIGTAIGYMAESNASASAFGADSRSAGIYSFAIGPSGAYAKAAGSMGFFDAEDGLGSDSANLLNGFFSRFKGGYEFYSDTSFSLKQFAGIKGAAYFTANPSSTSIGSSGIEQNSTLNVNGSLSLPLTRVSSNYSITSDDYTVIALNSVTLTLPGDVGSNPRLYELQNASGTSLTVATSSSQKIKNLDSDTATSYALASGSRITVQFDGTDWWIIQ